MTVTSLVNVNDSGRGGGDRYTPQKAVKYDTRWMRAISNSANDTAAIVLAYASVPKIGASHPHDSTLKLLERKAENNPSKGKLVWDIELFYSDEYDIAENPLLDPAVTEWDTEQFTKIVWKDRNGNAIVNSAGDPFDPPVERDDSRWVSVTRKNVGAVPAWIYSYQDAINSSQFTLDGVTVAKGIAKMQAIHVSEPMERNGTTYRVLTMTMHHHGENSDDVGSWGSGSGSGSSTDPGDEYEPWDAVILDAGFRELVSGSGSGGEGRQQILDSDYNPVTAPVPLDGSGSPLTDPSPANNVFLEFPLYAERDFNDLPLT